MKKITILSVMLLLSLIISCNNNMVLKKSDYADIRAAAEQEHGIEQSIIGTWENETMIFFLSESGTYGFFEIPQNKSVNGSWTTIENELFLVIDNEISEFTYSCKNTVLELKNKTNTYVLVKVSE